MINKALHLFWPVGGISVCPWALQRSESKAWFLPSLLTAQVERASPPGGVSPSVWVWESHCSSMRSPYSWRAPETWVYWTESWWSAPGQPASPVDKEREKMWLFKKPDIIFAICVIDWKSPSVSMSSNKHWLLGLAHPWTTCLWGSGQEK